eukprot:5102856-Alexandrium_andersonii.AAC.1
MKSTTRGLRNRGGGSHAPGVRPPHGCYKPACLAIRTPLSSPAHLGWILSKRRKRAPQRLRPR